MKGYKDQQTHTQLFETDFKPLFSTECKPGITPISLDQQTPLTSPINVTLGPATPEPITRSSTPAPPETWEDLVARQVNLGDPTPSPRIMDRTQNQSGMKGGGEHITWDELVKQGAMLGEDGTDTLAMQKKAPLFH